MSNGALELRNGAISARIGQATAVEQSRAVAEVQAQVIVAKRMPRDISEAEREMQRSCARKGLAEKAFYRYKRGGSQVSGETIVLAKELARCWGNIDYGLAELRRDDFAGESEMMAFAWDLQTNTRPRTTFIVPHVRDRSEANGGAVRLTETRDVYELNANMGARRMREMIFNVLPPWFIEDAKALCYATLAADDSDGKTTAERAKVAAEKFGRIGIRPEQLAQKLGAPQSAWSPADLAQLTVIFRSIERGETSKEDEFGATSATIAAADLAPPKNVPPAGEQPSPPAAPAPAEPAGGTPGDARHKALVGVAQQHFRRMGYTDADKQARLRDATDLVLGSEVPAISSFNDLTHAELDDLNRAVEKRKDRAALAKMLKSGDAGE